MVEIRLAKQGEVIDQKKIWKICFGDEDAYIDFYFSNKYNEDETALLLYNGKIAAMATMIPGNMVMPSGKRQELSMLYAIATHPDYQGKGFSTQIIEFCNTHLLQKGIDLSILVPAEESLFDFYSKRGYKEAFYIREIVLSDSQISKFTINMEQEISIGAIEANEYNERRRKLLEGVLYLDYNNREIDYQKRVSNKFGAEIYGINIGKIKGCAIVERINHDEIFIKEILMPEHLIEDGLKKVKLLLPAKNYIVRLPAYLGESLGGIVRPFGMIKPYDQIFQGKLGYMGIAYD